MSASGVTLTTIGSRGMRVSVEEGALAEAGPGGKTLWLDLHDKPLAVTFTAGEATWLAAQLRNCATAAA